MVRKTEDTSASKSTLSLPIPLLSSKWVMELGMGLNRLGTSRVFL